MRGTYVDVPLVFVRDVNVGDEVMVESGVAISKIENPKERN